SSAVFWPHVAAANDGGSQGFDVERFEPSAGSRNTILNIGGARVLEHKQFAIGLSTHYMDSPLVVFDRQTGETLTAVEHQLEAELLGASGLFDRVAVGFGLPGALLNRGDGLGMTGGLAGAYSAVSLADARLMAKYQFLSQERESPIG